jgi:osmotically-inducible protein OsmY
MKFARDFISMKRIQFTLAVAVAALAACDSRGPAQPARTAEKIQSSALPKAAPSAAPAADKELSSKVRDVLTASRDVEIGGVMVAAADGVVTLDGTVQMPAEKDRAAILALGIDGVRSVVNNLVVIRGS